MMLVINSLVPVLFILLIGFFLRRFDFLSHEAQKGLNKLAYWVALPVLLFYKVAKAPIGLE
ncbi:MAG: AEC family transporter, partial [Verrucomicrobiota bacterium]